MNSKFDDLVRSLDPQTLEELRRSVASELGGRREETAIQIEHIHPKMSAEARDQAAREIGRVLRGESLDA
jgi:DNA-directed RNA polymerase subunit F